MLNESILQEEVVFVVDGHGCYSIVRKTDTGVEVYDPMRVDKFKKNKEAANDLLYLLVLVFLYSR